MRFIFLSFVMLVSIVCCAAVYMNVDKSGNVEYTDVPTANSQPVDLTDKGSGISTINSTQSEGAASREKAVTKNIKGTTQTTAETASSTEVDKKKQKVPYTSFLMTAPQNQETFQNDRSIGVTFSSDPALQEGDLIQVFVDGVAVGSPVATTHIEVGGLNRGAHQFYGVLINQDKNILKQSASVTIFIHYANSNSRPN